MKAAVYKGQGRVEISEVTKPECPPGGLLIKTEACGLCSGELMDWYLDRKAPHVLGHEVCGRIEESHAASWKAGERVFVHHHAPCMSCDECQRGAFVHCPLWKRTRLDPGGMAEWFAAGPDNLTDAFPVGSLDPMSAALIEPIGCVIKSLRCAGLDPCADVEAAVVGLGSLGIAHLRLLGAMAVGYDTNPARVEWARSRGLAAFCPCDAKPAEYVFVCPGTQEALRFGLEWLRPGGTLVLFAPLPPGSPIPLDMERLYFRDLRLLSSYSCGPHETRAAYELLKSGCISHHDMVSTVVGIDELPASYAKMKKGDILKAMVVFG
jgi:L-iditol 2-dehydrogenase